MNDWRAHFHRGDMLLRWVDIYVYRPMPDGRIEVMRPDDMVEIIEPNVVDDGSPLLRLRQDQFDALVDAAYDERIRRGTAPDTEAKVLREMLAKEQSRVDHALGIPT